MKKFRLPKTARACIKVWLELPSRHGASYVSKTGVCPFGDVIGIFEGFEFLPCEEVCDKMFPSLAKMEGRCCPCHVLSLKYVIKRAKEIIK